MVEIGSKTRRQVLDYELSRYACYLIVQNGDLRKEILPTPSKSIKEIEKEQLKKLQNKKSKLMLDE